MFTVNESAAKRTTWQTLDGAISVARGIVLFGRIGMHEGEAVASYNLSLLSTARALEFSLIAVPKPGHLYNRAYLSWQTESDEQFFGLGEQYTVHGLRGRTVPIFTSEQGVGRGAEPLSKIVNQLSASHNTAGNWHTTYSAIGHYVTSKIRSVAVSGTGYTGALQ